MAAVSTEIPHSNGHDQARGLVRVPWLTAMLIAAFVLLALTTVTVALFATIDSKQKSDTNAERAFAEAQAARAESQAARAEVAVLQGQNTCRAGFAQLVDLAQLQGLGSLLVVVDDISRQQGATGLPALAEARVALVDAIAQRRDSTEVCAQDPAAKPDFSKVGGAL